MATLIIDGREIHAEEGQTILEVARANDIEIPALCYHPLLEPLDACRLCTVEVIRQGQSGLETSCTHPAEDGLEVKTDSPPVIEARRGVLGQLLSRCPNVPIVQELAQEYGVTEPSSPVEDPEEKCILCGLCVRACRELVKADVLNYAEAGPGWRVGPPLVEKADQCIGCGACAIVCPTGAIEIVQEREALYREKPLGPIGAIYVPSLGAVPCVPAIDADACVRFRQNDRTEGEIADACEVCQKLCEVDAVDFAQQDEIVELEVGTVIVATGYEMWDPTQLSQYSYGKSPNIITGMEFERLSKAGGVTNGEILLADGRKPERVAILHCVGSRDHNAHFYCSRICCMYSLKQAHMVRDETGAEVYEFYMDMRAFGKAHEEFYEQVQGEGVTFVRGRGAEVEVLPDGKLRVKGEDVNLGRLVYVDVDMAILSSAIEAPHDADQMGALLGLGRSENGFFAESHPKMRPVETNTDGVFLAGCAQGPRDIPDTVSHAGAAASMALALLDKGEVTISPAVAYVNEQLCAGCKTCVELCPYTAISFIEKDNVSRVNEVLCKGCGACAASCPSGAIKARHFTDQQIMAQIEGLLSVPRVLTEA